MRSLRNEVEVEIGDQYVRFLMFHGPICDLIYCNPVYVGATREFVEQNLLEDLRQTVALGLRTTIYNELERMD